MAASGSKGKARSDKDKDRAAYMRRMGICRTTARCSTCYRMITIESWKSSYTHRCWL